MMKPNVKRIISQLVNNLNITRNNKSLDEDDSWYITFVNSSYQVTEIRISNHKTNINTWASRQYKTVQPTKRISIVFQDNDFSGTSMLNHPIKGKIVVLEYVYDLRDGRTLSDKEVSQLTKAIRLAENGSFTDPIGNAIFSKIVGTYISQNTTTSNNDTVPATKWNYGADAVSESKNNKSKTNKNMKKNVIKLSENTLRQIVAESVRRVLKEYGGTPQTLGSVAQNLSRRTDQMNSVYNTTLSNGQERVKAMGNLFNSRQYLVKAIQNAIANGMTEEEIQQVLQQNLGSNYNPQFKDGRLDLGRK